MNVVLYTGEFEAITVLDLPVWLLEQLEKYGSVRVAAMQPVNLSAQPSAADFEPPPVVTIYCEKLRWLDGSTKPVLITYDEELALTLKPEWLSGQRRTVQNYQAAIRHLTDQLVRVMRK